MNHVLKLIKYHGPDCPYLGQNIGVAVLDTGIYQHPDFKNRIVAFRDMVHNRTSIYDDCGHGTHVTCCLA